MPKTVLMIDDDALLLQGAARTLAKEPFRLLQTTSADEALDLLEQEPIDVLLTDDRMPGMSGSALAAEVHALHPDVVTIMLTGDTSIGSLAQAVNRGHLFRLLLKPCQPQDLISALHAALAHKLVWDRCREAIPLLAQVTTLLTRVDARTGGLEGAAVDPMTCRTLPELAGHLDRELARLRKAVAA